MAKKTNKNRTCAYGDNDALNIGPKGNLYPKTSTFDNRNSCYNNQAVSMSSHPMFYVGQRVNTLGSNNPTAYAVMRYGNVCKQGVIYPGNTLRYPVYRLSIDEKGKYKYEFVLLPSCYCE